MNARNTVWIERSPAGNILRVFRSTHGEDWNRAMAAGTLETCPKRDAVYAIRSQIWKRCGGHCEDCEKPVTESGSLYNRMHQHEVVPKGNGGQVSLDNCRGLCYHCHIEVAHGDRKPRWTPKGSVEE